MAEILNTDYDTLYDLHLTRKDVITATLTWLFFLPIFHQITFHYQKQPCTFLPHWNFNRTP
jgi:hypothetical protein